MLALFAALIGPYFIDWTNYRAAFEAEASRALGQKVKVRGEADARLLPFPSVSFSDVVVGMDANGDPLMTIERFSMDAELAPFLRGEVLIFDMRVEHPTVTLRILPDGQLDWALRRKPSTPGETVVLEKITINDADIRIVDEQNDRSHLIKDMDAVASAASLSGPWQIDGTAKILGHSGAFSISTGALGKDGRLPLHTRIQPDERPVLIELEGGAEIADGKPRYEGSFTVQVLGEEPGKTSAKVEIAAVAKGRFQADNEKLRIGEYRLELGGGVDPYVITGEASIDTGPNPDFLLTADGQQVDVERFAARQGDEGEENEKDAIPAPSLSSRLSQLTDLLAQLPPPPLPGRVEITLPAIVYGDTTLRDIAIKARPQNGNWQVDRLNASLPGRTRVEASGLLATGRQPAFSGSLVVASSQPSGLSKWLTGKVDPVIRNIDAAGFSANVSLTPVIQRFEGLELVIGPAEMKGRLERQSLEGREPSISVDLAGDRFDVDAVRAIATLAGMGDSAVTDGSGFANLSARIAADVLSVGSHSVGDVGATLLWRDGNLQIDRLEFGDLAGASGSLSGSLSGLMAGAGENTEGLPEGWLQRRLEGQLEGHIKASEADGLLALAAKVTGDHSVIERLRGNSGAFDGLSADFSVELGGKNRLATKMRGTAGGGRFSIEAAGPALLHKGNGALKLEIEAVNEEAWRLASQAGFAVLPIDGAGAGSFDLSINGEKPESRHIEMEASIGEARLRVSGAGGLSPEGPATGSFEFSLEADDLGPALIVFGQSLPRTGLGLPANLSGQMEMAAGKLEISGIEGQIAGNSVSGKLGFDRTAPGIRADGALQLGRINLDWLSEFALGPRKAAAKGEIWSDEPFLAPSSGAPVAQIILQAEQFGLARAGEAQNLSAKLEIGPGRVEVSDARAEWMGGEISGDFSLNNPDGTAYLSGRMHMEGVGFARLSRKIAGMAPARGQTSLDASIEATGQSFQALAGSLSGGGTLSFDGLVIDDLYSGAFAHILGQADREGFEPEPGTVTWLASNSIIGGEMRAGSVDVPFTLTNGVQRFSAFSVADGKARLTGEGRIDLASMNIESRFELRFDPGREALAGADPQIAISVTGPLADPAYSIDAGALTNYLSIRAFERERRKVELLQAGVMEKQRMRRELALLSEKQQIREEKARAAREAARRAVEERERREAAERAMRQAQEVARQQAVEDAARSAAERDAREQAARTASEEGAGAGNQRPASPLQTQPEPAPDPAPARGLPELDFDSLPGVGDPIGQLISPN